MAVTGKRDVYFSVDIEADGPYPGDYSMVSIGCVYAGEHDGTRFIRPAQWSGYYAELQPISRKWNEEALAVSGLSRATLEDEGLHPQEAMHGLREYVREVAGANRAVFCGYPLGFDWLFTYWYLCKFGGASPFGHSNHVDIKTLYMAKADVNIGASIKRKMPDFLKSSRKHTHNALEDAIEQGELFANIMEWKEQVS